MKTKKLIFLLFVIPIILAGCTKDETDLSDEDIVIDNLTPTSIYKTKENYFPYVYVGIDKYENITYYPLYRSDDSHISIDENGMYVYNQRWKLKNGYIASKDMRLNEMAFTNITFNELVKEVDYYGTAVHDSVFQKRIINKHPFVEYYWKDGSELTTETGLTLGEINKMIKDGTLETVFTKLK